MQSLFERHREAEAARDLDAILETFVEDCYLETVALGLRSEGRAAARSAYEGYFKAFPDLMPDDRALVIGDDVVVAWGHLQGTSGGDWLGVPPSGRSFSVPFVNVAPFGDGLMAGESIYFDLATLCERPPCLWRRFAPPPRRARRRRARGPMADPGSRPVHTSNPGG